MVSHKCPQTAATNSKEKMSIQFTNVQNLLFRVYDKIIKALAIRLWGHN